MHRLDEKVCSASEGMLRKELICCYFMKVKSFLVVVWLNGFEVLFELGLVVIELVLLREIECVLDDSEHVFASLGSNVRFLSD